VTLTVRLFAAARDAAGSDEVRLEVEDGARVGDVIAALAAFRSGLGDVARRSRLAVNQAFARPDDPVRPGDEVALIPPVSGG